MHAVCATYYARILYARTLIMEVGKKKGSQKNEIIFLHNPVTPW